MDVKRAMEIYPRIKDVYEDEFGKQIQSGKTKDYAIELADAYTRGTVDELERCIICLLGKYDDK